MTTDVVSLIGAALFRSTGRGFSCETKWMFSYRWSMETAWGAHIHTNNIDRVFLLLPDRAYFHICGDPSSCHDFNSDGRVGGASDDSRHCVLCNHVHLYTHPQIHFIIFGRVEITHLLIDEVYTELYIYTHNSTIASFNWVSLQFDQRKYVISFD